MERVDGGSLAALRKACSHAGANVAPGIAARIVADMCHGLHAMHEACGLDGRRLGIVHRDVSRKNVLLTEDGIPRITDFGIAKANVRFSEMTLPGTIMGKTQYASPEQMAGRPVDRRTDIWGAGAVLWHLITGSPVSGDSGTLDEVAAKNGLVMREGKVPRELERVMVRALQRESRLRFATALEMAIALDQALSTSALSSQRVDLAAFAARHLAPFRLAQREGIARAFRRFSMASVPGEPRPDPPPAMLPLTH